MQSIKIIVRSLSIVTCLISCGAKEEAKKAEPTSEQKSIDSKAALQACVYASSTGTKVSGNNAEQCAQLDANYGVANKLSDAEISNFKAACSFNVNGVKEESDDQVKCEELAKKFSSEISLPAVAVGAGETQSACSYSSNGVKEEGNTKAKCDELAAKYKTMIGSALPSIIIAPAVVVPPASVPSTGGSKISCSYSINGVVKNGDTQAACDALANEYAASVKAGTTPAPAPGGSTQIACSYNNNGVIEKGSTQAECDALAKKYPFPSF